MPESLTLVNKLMQEHEVIQNNINRISGLSEDLTVLADIKDKSQEFTPFQYNFLNDRRINLRQNLVDFKDGLSVHYQQEERVFQPLFGDPVRHCLVEEHHQMLRKLSETDEMLLNLSPGGILYNGYYLKHKIEMLGRSIISLISMEGSLLRLMSIYLSRGTEALELESW